MRIGERKTAIAVLPEWKMHSCSKTKWHSAQRITIDQPIQSELFDCRLGRKERFELRPGNLSDPASCSRKPNSHVYQHVTTWMSPRMETEGDLQHLGTLGRSGDLVQDRTSHASNSSNW